MKISRQSEYYPTEESLPQALQAEAHRRAAESFTFDHLLDGPGIGRQGVDPRE